VPTTSRTRAQVIVLAKGANRFPKIGAPVVHVIFACRYEPEGEMAIILLVKPRLRAVRSPAMWYSALEPPEGWHVAGSA
jgi:hypothetical protein